jgi:hypothetical protein
MRLSLGTFVFATAGFSLCVAATASAEQFDIISRSPVSPGVERVRIDKPNPTVHSVEYPSITFLAGDTVAITAGGCVQSGGHGNTWHRYVNPSGGNADRLYKGLITIPFATGVLELIAKYQGASVTVRAGVPAGAHLQLGFQDDGYGDNGYYSHDNGPNDQCKGNDGGPAWVVLVITHGGQQTPSPGGPWDLLYTQFDENGIPLNPDWRNNVEHHAFPDPASCTWPWNGAASPLCTNQIADNDTYWVCQTFSKNFGFGGHANWTAGTYNGSVTWEEKSIPTQDDEYSVNLATPGSAGATSGRSDGIHVEFDSDETIDTLTDNFKLPWWKLFRSAVDAGNTQAHALIDGKEMIVTGLIGLDFAHNPGAESHPAWDLAIHANSNQSDDTWAIFARNWGNEGYCSGDQHVISYLGNRYTMSLKWPAGAVSGTVKPNTQFWADGQTVPSMSITFVPGQEVQVTFFGLADPSAQQLIGGELHIAWTMQPGRRFPAVAGLSAARIAAAARAPQPDVAEAFVTRATSSLSPAQRTTFQASLPTRTRAAHTGVRVPVKATPRMVRLAGRPTIRSVHDAKLVALKDAQIAALRKAYGGTIPGMP